MDGTWPSNGRVRAIFRATSPVHLVAHSVIVELRRIRLRKMAMAIELTIGDIQGFAHVREIIGLVAGLSVARQLIAMAFSPSVRVDRD